MKIIRLLQWVCFGCHQTKVEEQVGHGSNWVWPPIEPPGGWSTYCKSDYCPSCTEEIVEFIREEIIKK